MSAGVITVGGKKYAVGLYWQVSDTANVAKAARAAAAMSGVTADFFCVRAGNNQGRAPQFGLGEAKLGHAWNMPTAAATLANRQPGSWAGVFMVPEGVWFIEVRDGLIAPEGDLIFADEAEAMIRLQDVTARGGLEKIYSPPTWAIPGAEASSLASLLSGKAEARLQPVKVPKKLILGILGAIGFAIVASMAWSYYSAWAQESEMARLAEEGQRMAEQRRAEEEERKRREEAERQRILQEQASQLPTFQRTWEVSPKPLDWLDACRQAFEKVQIAPLGWNISGVSCSGSQVTASWVRTSGPAVVPEGAELDPNLRTASASYSLPELKPRGSEPLWPSEAINLYILNNDWQADITMVPVQTPPPMPNGQRVPPPPWQQRQIRWQVEISPWLLKGPLVDLPGFVVQSLGWSQDGTWQIEGTLYEQRK